MTRAGLLSTSRWHLTKHWCHFIVPTIRDYTVEARKLEHDCPPSQSLEKKETTINRQRPTFQLSGVDSKL